MNKTILVSTLALSLGLGSTAFAQSAPVGGPDAKGNAPLKHMHTVNDGSAKPGANSFTEGQARQHIVNSGYSDVTGLAKGQDGVWRGRASHNGAQVDVAMDFKGNVTEAGAAGGAMTSGGMQGPGGHSRRRRPWHKRWRRGGGRDGRRRHGGWRDGDAPPSPPPRGQPSPGPLRRSRPQRRGLQRCGLHRQRRLRSGEARHASRCASLNRLRCRRR